MYFDDDLSDEANETGSDELLSDDNLRLPDSANMLVRLHAVRSWLRRRQQETTIEIGEAAYALQEAIQGEPQERLRRRERLNQMERSQKTQQAFQAAQQRLEAYEEAAALLEECVNHTTSGERALVEYYLTLEEQVENIEKHSPRYQAFADVQHRVEHVGAPNED